MKRNIGIAIAVMCACGARANTIIYNNGGPDLLDGFEMTGWAEAEDVINVGAVHFDTVRFWTLGGPLLDTSVKFYRDADNMPGAVIKDFGSIATTSAATGRIAFGYAEYENVLRLTGGVSALGSFTYHMSLRGTKSGSYGAPTGVYWETTAANGTHGSYSSYLGNQPWSDNSAYGVNSELAFRLEKYQATPEPATLAVFGLGALLLRKRSKK